jgi:hypothetical protein
VTDSKPPETDEADLAPLDAAAEAALAQTLRAAYAPSELDPRRHAELVRLALEDPLAPPSEEELIESERLRRALDGGDERHPEARLARALAAAVNPGPLPGATAERLASRAARPKPNVLFVTFGALGLAAAASFALYLAHGTATTTGPTPTLARSRSTQELFREPFEQGRTTERIDRIAEARERDARENRYALWGVR